jgi:hypothetical protein
LVSTSFTCEIVIWVPVATLEYVLQCLSWKF